MKIAFDGRAISHPRRGGFKTYAENLIQKLGQLDSDNNYTVFVDRPYTNSDIERENVDIVPLENRGAFMQAVIYDQVSLPKNIKQMNFNLVHFPYNTASWKIKEKYIVTIHDITTLTHRPMINQQSLRKSIWELLIYFYPVILIPNAAKRAEAILTVSEYAKNEMINKLSLPSNKIYVIPLAANNIFRPLSAQEIEETNHLISGKFKCSRDFILTLGSSKLKNPQGVLAAYMHLPETVREELDIIIVIAHDRFKPFLEHKIIELGLSEKVHIINNLAPSDLLILYNHCEALVYPSFTESFPLPTIEAMACGTPIICSNNTGFPEQVGDAAIQVSPNDSRAIAEKLFIILTDSEMRCQLSAKAIARSKQYSWDQTAKNTLAVYQYVLTNSMQF